MSARKIGSTASRAPARRLDVAPGPNITAPIIIIYSITIGWATIAEASLSFLGFGLPPDVPSWGTMLSREGRQYMEMAPRLAMWPGVALTLAVYCLNMVGDGLRDLFDPRLCGGGSLAGGVGARDAERATRALKKLDDPAEHALVVPGVGRRGRRRQACRCPLADGSLFVTCRR